MATITAKLTNYRQSPRKVRLVANLIKGKNVTAALSELTFLPNRSGHALKGLIASAVANAKDLNLHNDNLYIKELRVDQGVTLHRSMPRARGRAFPIKKRSSHVLVVLDTKIESVKEKREPKKKPINKAETK